MSHLRLVEDRENRNLVKESQHSFSELDLAMHLFYKYYLSGFPGRRQNFLKTGVRRGGSSGSLSVDDSLVSVTYSTRNGFVTVLNLSGFHYLVPYIFAKNQLRSICGYYIPKSLLKVYL